MKATRDDPRGTSPAWRTRMTGPNAPFLLAGRTQNTSVLDASGLLEFKK